MSDTLLPIMHCDHLPCLRQVKFAPRLVVCSTQPWRREHRPIRCMTVLHYCEQHIGEIDAAELLTPRLKRQIEKLARRIRTSDFVPDFERAIVDRVLVTTPEYRDFTARIFGVEHVVA